jgi:hypothetical protein
MRLNRQSLHGHPHGGTFDHRCVTHDGQPQPCLTARHGSSSPHSGSVSVRENAPPPSLCRGPEAIHGMRGYVSISARRTPLLLPTVFYASDRTICSGSAASCGEWAQVRCARSPRADGGYWSSVSGDHSIAASIATARSNSASACAASRRPNSRCRCIGTVRLYGVSGPWRLT